MADIIDTCPSAVDFTINGCVDAAQVNLGDVVITSLGRIIQLDLTLRSVCPDKQVAVAVQLTEVDDRGFENSRGIKFFTVPIRTDESCTDVQISCIRFVVPEIFNSICEARNFRARVLANYIDTDFVCCDNSVSS